MRGAILCAPRDVRVEERDDPTIVEPTDAIIRLSATCICGSDLWPYRGIDASEGPVPMGHEYVGIVEDVGRDVKSIEPGQFVIGSFFASDNTCAICRAGYQTSCIHREPMGSMGTQPELARIPLADGTLVATRACVPPPPFVEPTRVLLRSLPRPTTLPNAGSDREETAMTTQPRLPKKGQKQKGGEKFFGATEPKAGRSKTQYGGVHDTNRRGARRGNR